MKAPSLSVARAAAFLALVLAAGCDGPPERHPRNTQVVRLSTELAAPAIEMGLVSEIKIVLPGPQAGSDYIWEIASNNNTVLEQEGPLKLVPASGAPDSAATTVASFYSLRPGKSVLRFFLVRPTDADAVPAAHCQVTVRIAE
jgi:hypothetical protein